MIRKIVTAAWYICLMLSYSFAQQTGRVELHNFFSPILGVTKNYNIYLPAGYDTSTAHYPAVYFLRLHEDEWFDPYMSGRDGTSLKNVADTLIANGHIGKMILVCPSTGSNNGLRSGAINMLHPELTTASGIGTGRFEDYLINDLIPHVDLTFRTIPNQANRGIDGFSLGGYSSIVISFRNPHVFSSVGSYDGTIMWYNLDDPSIPGPGPDDPIWLGSQYNTLFNPLFGNPRDINYMLLHSAINILLDANSTLLDSIRQLTFHIHASAVGNFGRNEQLVGVMISKGIGNTFDDILLAPNALHNYGFADLHASKSLIKHWETFNANQDTIDEEPTNIPIAAQLHQNYPNPFNPRTNIEFSIPKSEFVTLKVYNILGEEVAVLVSERLAAGRYKYEWDASRLASGIYLYQLEAAGFVETKKMVLVR
jgi:hypothetical protein